MVGATIGVALLGANFAFLGEAETGFIVAMSAGDSAQLLGIILAWRSL
ncbi:MAG TPA: hypothetical protein VN284_15490 [Rhizobium sp.]|nr:hypothetical protein [Rhizobium sp.]